MAKETESSSYTTQETETRAAAMCERPASVRAALVSEVAHMVAEWERSDELPSEFAARVVDYFLSKKEATSEASDCA